MLRIQKRTALPVWKSWLIRAIAIIIALVLNGVLIYGLTKMNPVKVYATMFNGVFGTERRIWNTIRDISMLLCIGIGLAPAFKMKFWNIGAEGQVRIGCLATAAGMICLGDKLPSAVLILVSLIAALAALYLRPGKRSPPEEADDGRQYYDGNGNHVYYDRRLIARPEKEKEEELQENNH